MSQQDNWSPFCMDAGFWSVVEIGQYFKTKDTADLTQFHAVACRECTLPREDGSLQPRRWIQGNTQMGPVLEVTTSCLHGKHGLWADAILTLGLEFLMDQKFLMDSNDNDTSSGCERCCMPIIGQSETTKKETCWLFIWNHSDEPQELDWYWPRETFSLCVRSFEESNSSSSSFSASTSRRGWSSSFLEN